MEEEIKVPVQPQLHTKFCFCIKAGVPVVMSKSIDDGILVGRCGKCKKQVAERVVGRGD